MPDVVIIPIEQRKPREEANYLEKLLFYTEAARGRSKLSVFSKKILKKVGGLDSSLGFGEDRLLEKKIFDILKVDEKVTKHFKI